MQKMAPIKLGFTCSQS